MTASERLQNMQRTVLVALVAALPWAVVPATDEKFDTSSVPAFVRVQFQGLGDESVGRVVDSGTRYRATEMRSLVVAECYARGTQTEEGSVVDLVERMADTVASALRYANLPLKDYVTDPTGGTSVSNVAIRFIEPPRVRALPSEDGWARRIVQAPAMWIGRSVES
jgi:hypothetical protein